VRCRITPRRRAWCGVAALVRSLRAGHYAFEIAVT
jgi:hypothetical protein